MQRDVQWSGVGFITFRALKSAQVRIEADSINMPTLIGIECQSRTWQWRYLAGIEKGFSISHRWKGNVQLLYNFRNRLKDGVPEKAEVRFGVAYRVIAGL